jgi:hypothetical protein
MVRKVDWDVNDLGRMAAAVAFVIIALVVFL